MRQLALAALFTLAFTAFAVAQPCLHGPNEDAEQKARRVAALSVVRAVNSAQANIGMHKTGKYLPLAELRLDLTKAAGFEHHFTLDDKGYAFLLKDMMDPCHFVFSTNEGGVIYQGYPIDFEVQPVKPARK